MSFVDKVKYINQLAVVDEFGGRGHADKITRFYIVLRVTDGNGEDIEITAAEVEEAVKGNNIVLCDYLNNREFTLGVLEKNPDNCDFIVVGKLYQNNTNLIGIDVREFKENASVCVMFRDNAGAVIASTTYLSDFPSCFFLNKKTTD
ncbi:hypothetical protein [Pantoea agglomerans]|uniref:hypothetical protein n=1 Tax=Enterobacter agglomerans TaxID=549 RepID=UPI002412F63B|nr:hypothetical protein [Pantoea agglomerans]